MNWYHFLHLCTLLQIICCVSAELLLLLLIMSFVDDDMLLLASNISVRHRYALTAKDNKRSRAYLSCKKINTLMITWYQSLRRSYWIQRFLKALIFLALSDIIQKYLPKFSKERDMQLQFFVNSINFKTHKLGCLSYYTILYYYSISL